MHELAQNLKKELKLTSEENLIKMIKKNQKAKMDDKLMNP